MEGPRPTSLEGDAPQTTVISRQRRFERMSHPALPLLPASEPSISPDFQRRKPPSPTSCPPSPTAAARALSPWWTVLPARVLQLPCGKLNPQEITVLLKSPDPAYTTLAPSPWSSNHNSPEETLTAASQVFQNQRKKCFPTPRSPDRGARPHPLVPSLAGCPPRAGDSLYPNPGLGPQLVEDGGWGWGKLVLCAPKQLWALGTSNQKELKPPGARGIGSICFPKGKQRCTPTSLFPNGTQVTKVGVGRREERDGSPGDPTTWPPVGSQGRGSPPAPDAYKLLLKEAKEV